MPPGISSADPDDLALFSQRGLDLDAVLQAHADTLAAAAGELASAGEPVAGLAGYAESLTDLVLDWIHLDQFAGRVAEGFLACAAAIGCDGTASLTVTDADLARYIHVGYADRDTAIAEARCLADDPQALLGDHDASADAIDASGPARRGRHDPAFAVTFSERIGVRATSRWPHPRGHAARPRRRRAHVAVLARSSPPPWPPHHHPAPRPAPAAYPTRRSSRLRPHPVSGYDTGRLGRPRSHRLSVPLA
jgi:hypothetical protein